MKTSEGRFSLLCLNEERGIEKEEKEKLGRTERAGFDIRGI